MPSRVQMSRQHPWRAEHPDAVIVARPGKWGNPFSVMEVGRKYPSLTADQCHSFAVNEFRTDRHAAHPEYPSVEEIRRELAGRDLACWCKLSEPCHADVLLEIANGSRQTPLTPADLELACELCRRVGGHAPTCLTGLASEIDRLGSRP